MRKIKRLVSENAVWEWILQVVYRMWALIACPFFMYLFPEYVVFHNNVPKMMLELRSLGTNTVKMYNMQNGEYMENASGNI